MTDGKEAPTSTAGAEKDVLLRRLSDGVVDMDEDGVAEAARAYLAAGLPPEEAVMGGLAAGMNRAGDLFDQEEYFVADILLCSDAMYAGLDVLRPHLDAGTGTSLGTGVIGVVEGDTHDIGKNLVKIMLEAAGFTMVDLGRDVAPASFVDAVAQHGASFVCLSTLMTTTMSRMRDVVELLGERGMRQRVKVLVGGGPVSQRFADSIGADGYSRNAVEAVKLARRLLHV